MPSHGDTDGVLPGAERLGDSGPACVPELPVARALCQPCEVKAAGLAVLPFLSVPLCESNPSIATGRGVAG